MVYVLYLGLRTFKKHGPEYKHTRRGNSPISPCDIAENLNAEQLMYVKVKVTR